MKHAKRMILVPEDMLNRYEQKQKIETSPITATMMHKDAEMSNTLQQTDMPNDQKEKLFYANLERYLNLKQQKDSQVPTVQLAPIKENPVRELSDAVIVETVPKRMRERATAILNRLKTRPDIISWDNTGQVKIEGESILQSNISDLISDAVRARKNFKPKGSNEFFHALSKMNMPKDLVRNHERRKPEAVLSGDDEPRRRAVTRQAKRPRIALSPKWQTY
jgi:hypothetical protein